MTVNVRIFGTLGEHFPGGRQAWGLPVEVPSGATVQDLLAALRLEHEPGIVALVDGRVTGRSGPLPEGVQVTLLQTMAGG